MEYLVEAGADLHAADYTGNTIFHHAASSAQSWELISSSLKAIIEVGGSTNEPNLQGRTILHSAAILRPDDWWPQRDLGSRMSFLLRLKLEFDVNPRDHQYMTPLHLASSVSKITASELIRAGAEIRAIDLQGRTPLHIAAGSENSNVVGLLCKIYAERNWPVNIRDRKGRTPLHEAARFGEPESVKFLLDCGASIDGKDRRGRNPLHACAEFRRDSRALQRQHDYDALTYPFIGDTFIGPTERVHSLTVTDELDARQLRVVIRLLLEAGVDPTDLDLNKCTAFDLALIMGCEQAVIGLAPLMAHLFSMPTINDRSRPTTLCSVDRLREQWYNQRAGAEMPVIDGLDLIVDEASQQLNRSLSLGSEDPRPNFTESRC